MIDAYVERNNNAVAYTSLGTTRYHSILKYSAVIMGNSSSGIIEAPSFKIPTINIGDRQKGRVKARSVIDCNPESKEIRKAMAYAFSREFKGETGKVTNPYDNGDTSEQVTGLISKYLFEERIKLKKRFYDIRYLE